MCQRVLREECTDGSEEENLFTLFLIAQRAGLGEPIPRPLRDARIPMFLRQRFPQ
jgi:hypothetical protein